MYRKGMNLDLCTQKDAGGEQTEGRGKSQEQGQEDVDHLLQWTQNLDEQILSTTPVL